MGWTTIDGDTSWQELAIAQEIATAYNKRVAALTSAEQTATGVSAIAPDQTMTVFEFVLAVQSGIEAMVRYRRFVDPDLDLEDDEWANDPLPSDSHSFWYEDAQKLFDAAGLTGIGGWRRVAEGGDAPNPWTEYDDAGWGYGKIQDKDMAGPWLFKDIQSALSKLCRRIGSTDITYIRMDAWEGEDNYDDPPVWPMLGSPSYAAQEFNTHVGGYPDCGAYFVWANFTWVTTTSSSKRLDVFASYTDITGADLINGNDALKDIRLWAYVQGGYPHYGPDTDFGTGLTLNRYNKFAEKIETTDTTISARILPDLSSWGTITGQVTLPDPGDDLIYYMTAGYTWVDVVYRWDP